MDINLEYLKIFYHVASCLNITKAAKKLCISQPAVSQALKFLEDSVEVKLFVRTAKGVVLTMEGEVLFSYVKRGYESMEQGMAALDKMKNLEAGEIRIGASDMTLQYYLLPFLERFHEQNPKIKVMVTNGPTPETLQYLKNGKIDFGIVSGPIPEDEEIIATPVKEIQDVFIAGSKFERYNGKVLQFQELEQLPVICLEKNTSTRKAVDDFLEEKQVFLKPEFELATSDMIVQFTKRNLGIGLVVEEFARQALAKNEIFRLQLKEEFPKRQFLAVTYKKGVLSTAANTIMKMMNV